MGDVIETSDNRFDAEVLQSTVPVLVEFHAPHCGACHAMRPILAELASELGNRAKIVAAEIEKNIELAKKYEIKMLPTLLVFVGGEVRERLVGMKSKEYLRSALGV